MKKYLALFLVLFSVSLLANELEVEKKDTDVKVEVNEIIDSPAVIQTSDERLYSYLIKQPLLSYEADEIYEEILKYSREFNVDSLIIAAIIKQESNYKDNVVSPAGAMGLMQLMPGTATSMGIENPFNIGENIKGGTKYFKMCLEKNNNDLALALASYNAGIGAVLKYKGIPPYAETQNYVNSVLKIYNKDLGNTYVYNEVEFEKAIKGIFAEISFENSEPGEI